MALREKAPGGGVEAVGWIGESELGVDFSGGIGNERPEEDGEDAASFGEVIEDGIEAVSLGGVFGEFERDGLVDELVGAIDDGPGGEE